MWIAGHRHLGPGRGDALELAGVRAHEPASGHTVRTVDENLVDHMTTVGKRHEELLQLSEPRVPPERTGAADFDDQPRRHHRLDRRPILTVDRRVQALHQIPDRSSAIPITHRYLTAPFR